jgi:hypothetical protein
MGVMLRTSLVILATAAACSALPKAAPEPRTDALSGATTIWSSVITAAFPDSVQVLLAAETIDLTRAPRSPGNWIARQLPADSAAAKDLLARNRGITRFTASEFDHRMVVVFDTVAQQRIAASRADAREHFYVRVRRLYPRVQGHLMLSLPGLSPDGRVALVYVQYSCGGLCGGGEGFTLEAAPGGKWVVVARRRYGVS